MIRLLIFAIGLIIAAAMLTLGVDRFVRDTFAPESLREDHAALVLIAAWSMLLGALLGRGQPVMGGILEVLAAGLVVIAASTQHLYLFAYAGATLLVAVATFGTAGFPPPTLTRAPRAPIDGAIAPWQDDAGVDPHRVLPQVNRHRASRATQRQRRRSPGAPGAGIDDDRS